MGLVVFVVGAALGATAVWVLMRRYRLDLMAREADLARLNERLDARAEQHRVELAAAEQRVELVRGDREQLRRDVQAVSADVLKKTGEALTREIAAQRLADHERAAGELSRRSEEIKRVVEPIGLKLGQMEGKVEQLERERREADGRLGETLRSLHAGVDSLAAQAGNLTSALRRPSTRGS